MNLDGAGDSFDHQFGLDGYSQSPEHKSAYDDRDPFRNGFGIGYGPPPPLPVNHSSQRESSWENQGISSSYPRKTHSVRSSPSVVPVSHSRPRSHYPESISPGAQPWGSMTPPGFQYGTGPILSDGRNLNPTSFGTTPTRNLGVDPVWLDQLLTKAVKQGVEESRRNEPQSNVHLEQQSPNIEAADQLPGAWPLSPFSNAAELNQAAEPAEHDAHNGDKNEKGTLEQRNEDYGKQQASDRRASHVTWNAETKWENDSKNEGWNSHEEMPDDSWDTDDTWATQKPQDSELASYWKDSTEKSSQQQHHSQPTSSCTIRVHDRSRKSSSRSRSRRLRNGKKTSPSSEDDEGWTHIQATPEATASETTSDDKVQPKSPQNSGKTSKSRSEQRRHRQKSSHTSRRSNSLSKNTHRSTLRLPPMYEEPAPSVITRITPTVMNPPFPIFSMDAFNIDSRKAGSHSEPASWGYVAPTKESSRIPSPASVPLHPAPYAALPNGFMTTRTNEDMWDHLPKPSSDWGDEDLNGEVHQSWGNSVQQKDVWGEVEDRSWGKGGTWTFDDIKKSDHSPWDNPAEDWSSTRNNDEFAPWDAYSTQTIAPVSEKPKQASPISKLPRTIKSISKYRRLGSTPSDLAPKPYWQFPSPPSQKKYSPRANTLHDFGTAYIAPKEPLHKISKETAEAKGIDRQVQAGEGLPYGHAVARPEYLDQLDKPVSINSLVVHPCVVALVASCAKIEEGDKLTS